MNVYRDGIYVGIGKGNSYLVSAMTDSDNMVTILNAKVFHNSMEDKASDQRMNKFHNDIDETVVSIGVENRPDANIHATTDTTITFVEDDM